MERVAGCRQTACRPLQVNGLRKGALGGARHEEGGEETQRGARVTKSNTEIQQAVRCNEVGGIGAFVLVCGRVKVDALVGVLLGAQFVVQDLAEPHSVSGGCVGVCMEHVETITSASAYTSSNKL